MCKTHRKLFSIMKKVKSSKFLINTRYIIRFYVCFNQGFITVKTSMISDFKTHFYCYEAPKCVTRYTSNFKDFAGMLTRQYLTKTTIDYNQCQKSELLYVNQSLFYHLIYLPNLLQDPGSSIQQKTSFFTFSMILFTPQVELTAHA